MDTVADTSPRQSGRELRHAREARTKIWRVSVVAIFFAVVLGANLFVGATLMLKALRVQAGETAASTRIGRVSFPMLDGVFCRHVLFDNTTAEATEDRVSRCDDDRARERPGRTTSFNWGKQ
jgi:hypothetical protein